MYPGSASPAVTASPLTLAARAWRVVRFSISSTPMTSGERITLRMASEALSRRFWKASSVSTGSPVPSLLVSKKRSMLNEPTVNSFSDASGTGTARPRPDTAGGVAGSGRIVQVRNEKSSGPVRLVTRAPEVTSSAVPPGWPSLSTRSRSGFSSKRGMQQGAPGGSGSVRGMPGSRAGRAMPSTTP